MKLRTIVLGFYAVVFLIFGVAGIFWAEGLANMNHIEVQLPSAKMEFSTTFGGLYLGVAAFWFYCMRRHVFIGLVSVLSAMGGLAFARIVGAFSFGGADAFQYLNIATEVSSFLFVGFLLIKADGRPDSNLVEN